MSRVRAKTAGGVGIGRLYFIDGLFFGHGYFNIIASLLAHLALTVQPDYKRIIGHLGLRLRKCIPKETVETAGNLARKLKVGQLVFADGHYRGFVKHNIRSHQHRIADKPVVDVLRLQLYLFLEGRHPQQPTQRGYHTEQGMQLHHLRHVGLHKKHAFFGLQAYCQPVENHFTDIFL